MVELVAISGLPPLRAVVTGAADGVGAQCARALALAGDEVAITDIDKVPLARLANAIGAHAFACDVLSEFSVNQLVEQVSAVLPRVDLLINAAGKGYVRTLGMMRVGRAFAGAGHAATIVNIAAPRGSPEPFGYAGSKQAFERLSEGLGCTLRQRGLRVVTVAALATETDVAELIAALRCAVHALPAAPRARSARGGRH